jgi:glucuronoarabinoxylan endo-1,4-beta-xylanase
MYLDFVHINSYFGQESSRAGSSMAAQGCILADEKFVSSYTRNRFRREITNPFSQVGRRSMTITRSIPVTVDPGKAYQVIDGFGVNINSKYWNNGALIPVLDWLIDDLGATMFRLDAYGNSNWVDPDSSRGPSVLNDKEYQRIYRSVEFGNAKAVCRYLNDKGIDPYITLSGMVPAWMCGPDGKTLERIDLFAEMAVSYLEWLRKEAQVRFSLFCPLNETDLGPPEGPVVNPQSYVNVIHAIAALLDKKGLGDIRFVVAEQGRFDTSYIEAFERDPSLRSRIEAFGLHTYFSYAPVDDVVKLIANGPYAGTKIWMTEYGDLDQTGEREFYFSRIIHDRLLHLLRNGMSAALNWDAFDNYHDHDAYWTIYGLIRTGLRTFTRKKRYYACKQVYRYVRPGYVRLEAAVSDPSVRLLAFRAPDSRELVVTGYNDLTEDVYMRIDKGKLDPSLFAGQAQTYVTTGDLDCAPIPCTPFRPWTSGTEGVETAVPAKSMFTIILQTT